MKTHPCLAAMGNTADCQICSISRAGLLNEFLDLLSRLTQKLKAEQTLQDPDREEIIAQFAIQAHQKVDQFRGVNSDGTRSVKFRTWGHRLFHGVRVDFYRKWLGRRNKGESPPTMVDINSLIEHPSIDPEHGLNARMTLDAIGKMLEDKHLKSHARLLIDHCEWQHQGLSQKDMADRMGLEYPAFRKKFSRARKVVFDALKDDE